MQRTCRSTPAGGPKAGAGCAEKARTTHAKGVAHVEGRLRNENVLRRSGRQPLGVGVRTSSWFSNKNTDTDTEARNA